MKTMTAIFLTLLAATASAQDYLEVETTVQKQELYLNDAGEEATRMVTAERVLPGETVYYTITFTNVSDEVADNVVITNPIAEDLVYLDGSAFGPEGGGSRGLHPRSLGHAKRFGGRRAGNCAVCRRFEMRSMQSHRTSFGRRFDRHFEK